MKGLLILTVVVPLLLTGCGTPHFASLPNNPSSIDITKYHDNGTNKTSFKLTGATMESLYKSLQGESKRTLPKNSSVNCPTYTYPQDTIWDYHIVIHYPNHPDRSFTQTTNGCTFVKDDETGATAMGVLDGLNPFPQ